MQELKFIEAKLIVWKKLTFMDLSEMKYSLVKGIGFLDILKGLGCLFDNVRLVIVPMKS